MRFSLWLVATLGLLAPESDSRNILSAFIRPHARFLIQSVVENPTENLAKFQAGGVSKGQYCQASSSLVTSDGKQALPLFNGLLESVKESVSSTRKSLSLISDNTKKDDVRRAQQMGILWNDSIISELNGIIAGIEARAGRFGAETVKNVNLLKEKSQKLEGKEVSEIFPKSANKQFASSADQHDVNVKAATVAADAEGKDEVTPAALSPAEYQAMAEDYEKANKDLTALKGKVSELVERAKAIMTSHETGVKTGLQYQLKWMDVEDPAKNLDGLTSSFSNLDEVQYKSEPSKSSEDSFEEADSESLGKKIHELIARVSASSDEKTKFEDFKEFVSAPTSSEVERLDRLSSTLNILVLRKLGMNDAMQSLNDLLTAVKAEAKKLNDELTKQAEDDSAGLFIRIGKELQSLEAKAKTVYTEASALPNVEINPQLVESDTIDNLDRHMATLAGFVGTDAHGEFLPHVNLIVNVLWRAHGHMLAFLEEYQSASLAPLLTTIDQLSLEQPSEPNRLALVQKNELFREAADCVLYGRVDSILRRVKIQKYLTESQLCDKLHGKAVEAMKKIVNIDTLKKGSSLVSGSSPALNAVEV